jgi:hypothetical protein
LPVLPPPPPPIATAATDVTPLGTTNVYVPGDVYVAHVTAKVVIELLAALAALVPTALVAVTVNVYAVFAVKPLTVMVPEPA